MRLIDADAVNKAIADSRISLHTMRLKLRVSDIVLILQHAPTIDAVPVVRCKDCVKRKTDNCPMYHEEFEAFDSYDGSWIGYDKTTDNGFCQCGKKWR